MLILSVYVLNSTQHQRNLSLDFTATINSRVLYYLCCYPQRHLYNKQVLTPDTSAASSRVSATHLVAASRWGRWLFISSRSGFCSSQTCAGSQAQGAVWWERHREQCGGRGTGSSVVGEAQGAVWHREVLEALGRKHALNNSA